MAAGAGALRASGGAAKAAEPKTILMLGGTIALNRNVALVTENWLILDENVDLGYQPLGAAVRFYGSRLSADIGFVFTASSIKDAYYIPWASVSYHFGPSRPRDSRAPLQRPSFFRK